MSMTFDARPLTDPVDSRAVSAFMREQRTHSGSTNWTSIIGLVVGGVIVLTFIPTLIGAMLSLGRGGSLVSLPLIIFVVILGGFGAFAFFNWRSSRTTAYRLHLFAQANGMTYEDTVKNPPLPGMLFHVGGSRVASKLVRGHQPRFVEFGNYQYTTGSGKNQTTHTWGYVAVKLDVPLPNIVLDAVGNNSIFGSNLPARFDKEQRLSLEGDFDQHFELYCPRGYEADALYLFTPDIMARFIDHAAELDVEIVDDWMFLYTKRRVSTLDPSMWAWLFGVVGALMTKFDQWARWRDERLRLAQSGAPEMPGSPLAAGSTDAVAPAAFAAAQPAAGQPTAGPGTALPFAPPAGMLRPPPGVAKEGRRLKRSVNWIAITAVIILGILWTVARML